jgi:hypothetical protein
MDKQQSELVAPPPPLLALEIGGEREKEAHLNEIANIYEEGDEGKEEYEQFLLESHKIPEKYSLSKLGLEQAIDSMVRPYIKTRPLNPKNPITDFHAPRSPRTPELDNKHDSIENRRLKAAQNHGPKAAAVKRHENKSPRKLGRLLAAKVKSGQVTKYKAGVAFNLDKFKSLVENAVAATASVMNATPSELIEKMARMIDENPVSASLKDGTAEVVTKPEDITFDDEPLPLDHAVMQRLEKVWADLDIAAMAQVDNLIRYNWCGGARNEHLELLVQLWENLRDANKTMEGNVMEGKITAESARLDAFFFFESSAHC